MAEKNKMEIGTIFEFKANVYQVMDNKDDDSCFGCYAFGKHVLCKQLPMCSLGEYQVKFRKLNSYEIRQVKQNNKKIIKL